MTMTIKKIRLSKYAWLVVQDWSAQGHYPAQRCTMTFKTETEADQFITNCETIAQLFVQEREVTK